VETRTGPWPEVEGGSITVERTADGQVLHLSGDVDAGVVKELKAHDMPDLSGVVAVDVGDLSYIDSSGLTLLVRWAQEAARAGRRAEIRRPTPRFNRVLEVAGVAPLFVAA
jgi:anti-anti-sigma factor